MKEGCYHLCSSPRLDIEIILGIIGLNEEEMGKVLSSLSNTITFDYVFEDVDVTVDYDPAGVTVVDAGTFQYLKPAI